MRMSRTDELPPLVEKPTFFLDYDGTLAPIVDDPGAAYPHPDAEAILSRLHELYPVWIITGRDLETLGHLLPIRIPAVGLHGVAWGVPGQTDSVRISDEEREVIRKMRRSLPSLDGLFVEEKGALFAVHYRDSKHPDEVARALINWANSAPESLEAIHGKFVMELRPRGRSKGAVVRELSQRQPARTPMYIGDDTTDEDAFVALRESGLTIKVGAGETAATHRLPDVSSVIAYLSRYL